MLEWPFTPLLRTILRRRPGTIRDDPLIGFRLAPLRLCFISGLTTLYQSSADAVGLCTPFLVRSCVKAYERFWWSVVIVFGAVGAVEAALVVAPFVVLAVAAAAGVLAGLGGIASLVRQNTPSDSGLNVAKVAIAAAVVGVVMTGLASLLGAVAAAMLVAVVMCHPWVLGHAAEPVRRWLRPDDRGSSSTPGLGRVPPSRPPGAAGSSRGVGASAPPKHWASKVVPRTPPADQGWPDAAAMRLLSTAQLCWGWRVSFTALERTDGRADRRRWTGLVEVRQRYLDEIARRDPAGLARWLYAGARPASDPGRYLLPPRARRSAGRSGVYATSPGREPSLDSETPHA